MMETRKYELTLAEEMLGGQPNKENVHREFIASKAPDAAKRDEEIAAIGADEFERREMTVFPRVDGHPGMWDYQLKGFMKDACGMLRGVPGSESARVKSYKKRIDGLIFVKERFVPFKLDGIFIDAHKAGLGECPRILRAETMQGPRTTPANSETVPAGCTLEFGVTCLDESLFAAVEEWLDYGALRGFGQWRNSGKGKFTWEVVD